MPSVHAAAMNTIEASNSFSPFSLLKRLLERIQISRGMLRMRISVMELGRFTTLGGSGDRPEDQVDYAPQEWGTQWNESVPFSPQRTRRCAKETLSGLRLRGVLQAQSIAVGIVEPQLGHAVRRDLRRVQLESV